MREALILTEGGAEVKSYSAAAQAVLLVLFVPAYGVFASRVPALKLIMWVTLFFIVQLIVFYFAGKAGSARECLSMSGWGFSMYSS